MGILVFMVGKPPAHTASGPEGGDKDMKDVKNAKKHLMDHQKYPATKEEKGLK